MNQEDQMLTNILANGKTSDTPARKKKGGCANILVILSNLLHDADSYIKQYILYSTKFPCNLHHVSALYVNNIRQSLTVMG